MEYVGPGREESARKDNWADPENFFWSLVPTTHVNTPALSSLALFNINILGPVGNTLPEIIRQ